MDNKALRVISLYTRMMNGERINREKEAERSDVDVRSIQRDLSMLRKYLEENPELGKKLTYNKDTSFYSIVSTTTPVLTPAETFAVCKILLESRSLSKREMFPIISKLIKMYYDDSEYHKLNDLISNERFHYIPPHHNKKLISKIWTIAGAVRSKSAMRITYKKLKGSENVKRIIKPVGIMFSEFYFYLIAYICDDIKDIDSSCRSFPTIYRIDRIDSFKILDIKYNIPYADRFEEGEFRKRIQFMFGGELRKIRFLYKGLSIEAVLDRLPTAEVLNHDENGWLVKAEVYGDGVDMWIRSQGDMIEIVK